MGKYMDLARQFRAEVAAGEKGDKGEKTLSPTPLSPFSPLFHPPVGTEIDLPGLSGLEPWDSLTAIILMGKGDELVERLGVSGLLPAIQTAAAMVASAYPTRDMETLRFSLAEFEDAVRVESEKSKEREKRV